MDETVLVFIVRHLPDISMRRGGFPACSIVNNFLVAREFHEISVCDISLFRRKLRAMS